MYRRLKSLTILSALSKANWGNCGCGTLGVPLSMTRGAIPKFISIILTSGHGQANPLKTIGRFGSRELVRA